MSIIQELKPHQSLSDPLYVALAQGVQGMVHRVIVGQNWTLVVGPDSCGVSHTPTRGTNGCRALPQASDYARRDLSELATLLHSDNIFEATIAIAAINAFHNSRDREGGDENGLDLVEDRGTRTVIVGRFPGLERRLPDAAVIEHEPGPNDYPTSAAETLLPACEQLVITASTLLDGALPRLLELAPQAFTVLLGPGTPLADVLFDCGVDALSGLVVEDSDAIERVIIEGGAVSAMKRHARNITIRKPPNSYP